jgi:hypothetical protein
VKRKVRKRRPKVNQIVDVFKEEIRYERSLVLNASAFSIVAELTVDQTDKPTSIHKKYTLANNKPPTEPPLIEDEFASSKGQRLVPESDTGAAEPSEMEIRSNTLEKNKWSGEYKRLEFAHNVYQNNDKEE